MSIDNPRGLPENGSKISMPRVKAVKQESPELFHDFRLAYMEEYLNKLNDGKSGHEVIARLKTALEAAMVGGIDVVQIADPNICKWVADLHAAVTLELANMKQAT